MTESTIKSVRDERDESTMGNEAQDRDISLERVQMVVEKTGVSYEDARDALERCKGDILDAIIILEHEGKAAPASATYSTGAGSTSGCSDEMRDAQEEWRRESRRGATADKVSHAFHDFFVPAMLKPFVVESDGRELARIPVFIVIILLLACAPLALAVFVVSLFLGVRYHLEGATPVRFDLNETMDKAADMATSARNSYKEYEKKRSEQHMQEDGMRDTGKGDGV